MHRLAGTCACGAVAVEVGLANEPGAYSPRACDCDFCCERKAAWLSDPDGSLLLRLDSAAALRIERQGSEQAEFLSCAACATLLAVRWQDADGRSYAAVNARRLEGRAVLGGEQIASPKRFDAEQKIARWRSLWFADFAVMAD